MPYLSDGPEEWERRKARGAAESKLVASPVSSSRGAAEPRRPGLSLEPAGDADTRARVVSNLAGQAGGSSDGGARVAEDPCPERGGDAAAPDDGDRDLKADAKSIKHPRTHTPKKHHTVRPANVPKPSPEHARADTEVTKASPLRSEGCMVSNKSEAGTGGERTALAVKDRGTNWMARYPLPDKSSEAARPELLVAAKSFW